MKVGIDSMVLGAWVQPVDPTCILDIGTGTGILSLMMAQRFDATIDAIEIVEAAARQAMENFATSKWSSKLSVHYNSIQEFAAANNKQFDFIITNPPYFSNSLKSENESRNNARHNDSLSPNELLSATLKLLSPTGRFALILPASDARQFEFKANVFGLFCERRLNVKPKDTKGVHRVVMEFVRQKINSFEETICIRNENGYTSAYKNLCNCFYLDLK